MSSLNADQLAQLRRIAAWVLKHRHLHAVTDQEIFELIDTSIEHFKEIPALVRLSAPVTIFGDLHGQLAELIEFFKLTVPEILDLEEPKINLLFLGDYVDRGKYSLEIAVLLFCLKLLFPTKISCLRGNHECSDINYRYGFYNDIMTKKCGNYQLWTRFNELFKELPLCALVSGEIFCMHGGLPRKLDNWSDLTKLEKPRRVADCYDDDNPIANDLLWADPSNSTKKDGRRIWHNISRGTSIFFNQEYLYDFLKRFNLKAIVRAHEHTVSGYQLNGAKNLCTIFTAPRYLDETDRGAVMTIPASLAPVKFTILRPLNEGELRQIEEPKTPRPSRGNDKLLLDALRDD